MALKINFSATKTKAKPANNNIHDPIYWGFAHDVVEHSTPINQWPRQYTVHYIYEFMNRPWLSERDRLNDMHIWLTSYAPDLQIGSLL